MARAKKTLNAIEMKEYFVNTKNIFNRLSYDFLNEPLFQSLGLDLSAISVVFEDDNSFSLKDVTFGYFNPVDNSIHINIQHPFFFNVRENLIMFRARLLFILFHEAFHQSLMHTERRNMRLATLWNIAADYEIHNMLWLYKSMTINNIDSMLTKEFEIIENLLNRFHEAAKNKQSNIDKDDPENFVGMFDKKLTGNTAEEIYAIIEQSKKTEEYSFSISGQQGEGEDDSNNNNDSNDSNDTNGKSKNKKSKNSKFSDFQENADNKNSNNTATVTVTTYELPNGQKITTYDIDAPDNRSLDEKVNQAEQKELRRQIMQQNIRQEAEKARQKGNISADCDMLLKKLFKVKVDWAKILKSSLQTILAKSDYFTWARPRRSTMCLDLPYLPDQCDDNSGYGKLYICVDQSGSMSNNDFSKIGNIIIDAKEHYKKIVVIQHDTHINNIIEVEYLDDDLINQIFTRTSCGGTSHKDVFEHIMADFVKNKYNDEENISAVIVCSDCCSDIQTEQKKLAASIPMIYMCPEDSINYTDGIKGKIIAVS